VTVRSVDRIVNTRIDITCLFHKQVVTFRFFASSKGMAENIAEVLRSNSGKSLRDLGKVLVDTSES